MFSKGEACLFMTNFKKNLMKSKLIRLVAVLAVTATAGAVLSSCVSGDVTGGIGIPPVTESPADIGAADDDFSDLIVQGYSVDEAAEVLGSLPDADMDGVATVIGTVSHDDILCPTEAADEVSAAALKRNKYIEDKYSTTIVGKKEASAEALMEAVRKSKEAGMYYADMLAVNVSEVGGYAEDGLLLNLHSLPGIDFGAEYYNSEAMSQLSAGYKLYAVSSAATGDARDTYAVFYNKTLAEQLGMGSLYDTVRSGGWTWEQFTALMQTAAAARGSDAATFVGAVSDLPWENFAHAYLMTSGTHYIDTTYGALPSLAVGDGQLDTIIEKARGIFAYGQGFRSGFESDSSAVSSFRAGDVLFYVGKLSDAEMLAPIEVSWGVLPLPSYSAEREGYTVADPSSTAVLVTTADNSLTANTALIIQAMSAASVRCMGDAVTEYVQNTALRDNDSIEMVRLIASKIPVFDLIDAFPTLTSVNSATSDAFYNAIEGRSFYTYYNRYRTAATNLLRRTFPLDNAE